VASVRIAKPGLQTTIQDLGRWGYQANGVPVSGAMDIGAHRTANALAGNAASAATLEITLVGPEFTCNRDCVIGVAGARFDVTVHGTPVPSADSSFEVAAGQPVRFGARLGGARAYVAIDGGFIVPEILGSRSTHLSSRMGGFEGRALRAGDRIPIGAARAVSAQGLRALPLAAPGECVLRVLPSPDLERFDVAAFDALVSGPYVVRSESNRMGYRLRGPRVALREAGAKISDAVPLGLIQMPPLGDPVLLMADRPTTGGYAAIANVITADIDLAAQLAPGDAFRFAPCSVDDALDAIFDRERHIAQIEASSRG
jgi:antagonist of KipI